MKINFILFTFILLLNSLLSFAQKPDNYGLVLSGEVKEVEIVEYKDRDVGIIASVSLKLLNTGTNTLILVNPTYYQHNLPLYSLSSQQNRKEEGYRSASYPTSSSFPKEHKKLAENLDSKKPPKEYTIILKPNQSFIWDEDIYSVFNIGYQSMVDFSARWKELRENGDKFWFSYSYSLPWAINYLRPNILETLPKRWEKYGVFPISCSSEENCEKKDFKIKTEPIFIDFSQAKMKQSS